MKIAAVSDDGMTISQHFGRAALYVVMTVEDGKIVSKEVREKMGHAHFVHEPHSEHDRQQDARGHGFDPAAQSRHARMIAAIADCQVLLAGGMGAGAYESLKQANIRAILTDMKDIEQAVQAYLAGTLEDHIEKLH